MTILRPTFLVAAVVLSCAVTGPAAAAQPRAASSESQAPRLEATVAQATPPPTQQDEFVPIAELPPQDQLPAAPLLIAAYAFVMLALFAYVASVATRLGGVQKELERLEADLERSRRS